MLKDIQIKKTLLYLLFLFLMCWTMIALATEVRQTDVVLMIFILVALVLAIEKVHDYNVISKKLSNQSAMLSEIFLANDKEPVHYGHAAKSEIPAVDCQNQLSGVLDSMISISYLKDFSNKRTVGNKKFENLRRNCGDANIILYEDLFSLDDPYEYTPDDANVAARGRLCKKIKEINSLSGKKWIEVNKAPIFDAESNLKGIVVILKDVTAEHEVKLEKETFVETLKHDLKTPAYAQIQALNLLMKGNFGNLTGEQKVVIRDIQNSCRYMFDMISTIINTYKFEDGLLQTVPTEFNIIDLINETYEEVSYLAEEKGQTFEFENSMLSENIFADMSAIRRVLMSLMYNAINHSYSNSVIRVCVSEEYDRVIFEITSKGHPIPQDNLEDIYNKYFMTKNKFRLIGMGLGLYLSKEIIKIHNGEMIAASTNNSNTFGFEMPKKYINYYSDELTLSRNLNISTNTVDAYAQN